MNRRRMNQRISSKTSFWSIFFLLSKQIQISIMFYQAISQDSSIFCSRRTLLWYFLNKLKILRYLYIQKPSLISCIINHSNRRAIIDILPKIIQIESHDVEFSKNTSALSIRIEVIKEFILKLKSNNFEVITS